MAELLPEMKLARRTAFRLSADDPSYVLHLAVHPGNPQRLAASSSDFSIKLYDKSTMKMSKLLKGHTGTVTGLRFARGNPDVLFSCSLDGTFKRWDLSTGSITMNVHIGRNFRPLCMDLSCDDRFLAIGTDLISEDAWVLLYDLTTEEQLVNFSEAHSDDVIDLSFGNYCPTRFATASTDGLVNVFDVSQLSEAEEPEDCIVVTHNTESSAARVGFFGPADEFLFGLTHVESVMLWNALPSEDERDELIANFKDLRTFMTEEGLQTDYFIDCIYQQDVQRLFLVAGSDDGNIHISHVNIDGVTPALPLYGGHSGVVRCLHWDEDGIVTGGEDSILCQWSTAAEAEVSHAAAASGKVAVAGTSPAKSKPYSR